MKNLVRAIAAIACVAAMSAPAVARAAPPEFGTPEGELACVAVVDLARLGASAAKPPVQPVVVATTVAHAFYMGRLSKVDPDATRSDIDAALKSLSAEDQNAYVNTCMKRAAALLRAQQQLPPR